MLRERKTTIGVVEADTALDETKGLLLEHLRNTKQEIHNTILRQRRGSLLQFKVLDNASLEKTIARYCQRDPFRDYPGLGVQVAVPKKRNLGKLRLATDIFWSNLTQFGSENNLMYYRLLPKGEHYRESFYLLKVLDANYLSDMRKNLETRPELNELVPDSFASFIYQNT